MRVGLQCVFVAEPIFRAGKTRKKRNQGATALPVLPGGKGHGERLGAVHFQREIREMALQCCFFGQFKSDAVNWHCTGTQKYPVAGKKERKKTARSMGLTNQPLDQATKAKFFPLPWPLAVAAATNITPGVAPYLSATA